MSKVKGAKSLKGIPWEEMLYYDETSPSRLRHKNNKVRPNNLSIRKYAGEVAGSLSKLSGYWTYSSKYGTFQCHRIIWYLVHGEDVPDDKIIDHIDGNKSNNNINNLRLLSEADNNRNAKLYKNNTTGVVGIYFDTKTDRKGFPRTYWKASWQELDGSQKTKAFSIEKLGHDDAKRLALEYRNQQIERLNKEGANYTERHGT